MRQTRLHNYFQLIFDNKDLNQFFVAMSLRMFAISLLAIFIPAVLWVNGMGLKEIALFFFLWTITHTAFSVVVGKLLRILHGKYVILLSYPFYILFFYLMEHITAARIPFAALSIGLGCVLFWIPYHTYFAQKTPHTSRGRKIGVFTVIVGVLGMIAPVIGGIFIEAGGFVWLISLMTVLMILSVFPLMKMSHERPMRVSGQRVYRLLRSTQGLGYIAHGFVNITSWALWPLFLFILLGGFVKLGLVSFFTSFLALLITLWAGTKIDSLGNKKILRKITYIESFLWVVRLFVAIPFFAILIDALDKLVLKIYYLAIDARSYELGSDTEHVVVRELGINLGSAIAMIIIFMIPSFHVAFLLAALGALWVTIL